MEPFKEKLITSNNKQNLKSVWLEVFLLLISLSLNYLAFPNALSEYGCGVLILIAFIPLFIVVKLSSFKTVWFWGFLYACAFYLSFNSWIISFGFSSWLTLCLIKGSEYAVVFLLLKLVKLPSLEALVWVLYSLFEQLWFASYPYGLAPYALSFTPVFIQTADLFGIYGIMFFIMFPQALLADTFQHIKISEFEKILCIVTIVFHLIYGFITYRVWNNAESDKVIKVVTIQHNVNTKDMCTNSEYVSSYEKLKDLTLKSPYKEADLVVWPETAIIPSVNYSINYRYGRTLDNLVSSFLDLSKEIEVPILIGNPFENKDESYNAAILFENGNEVCHYFKQHLVPFTEYFPFEDTMPHLASYIESFGYVQWNPGSESTVFDFNGIKFSTPICFEDSFGGLCAKFVYKGANLLINLTNDSWSESSMCETQHMAMSVLRAVENRKSVLRCTNSGVTCLIAPSGVVQDRTENFTSCYALFDVGIFDSSQKTLYTLISGR